MVVKDKACKASLNLFSLGFHMLSQLETMSPDKYAGCFMSSNIPFAPLFVFVCLFAWLFVCLFVCQLACQRGWLSSMTPLPRVFFPELARHHGLQQIVKNLPWINPEYATVALKIWFRGYTREEFINATQNLEPSLAERSPTSPTAVSSIEGEWC